MDASNSLSIIDSLEEQARLFPLKPAFVYFSVKGLSVSQTYKELHEGVISLAAYFQSRSIPGEKIILVLEGEEFVCAFLASLYAGLIPVILPLQNDFVSHLRNVCKSVDVKYIVTGKIFCENFVGVQRFEFDDIKDFCGEYKKVEIQNTSLAFLQFSSGSLAEPKGIMISHNNVMSNLSYAVKRYGADYFKVGCCWTPIQHDMGLVGGILLTLYTGAATVLIRPPDFLTDPVVWLQAISQYKVTFTFSPNFAFDRCLAIAKEKLSGIDLSSWCLGVNGGEIIKRDTLQRFSERFSAYGLKENVISPSYGLAETTMAITADQCLSPATWLKVSSEDLRQGKIVSDEYFLSAIDFVGCGKVLDAHELVIVSIGSKKILENYKVGEIWVRGPSVALGYWCNNNRVEEDAFSAKLNANEDGYLRTGDLGFTDNEKNVYIVGRLNNIIIFRGKNYYIQDIEKAILTVFPLLKNNSIAIFEINNDRGEIGVIIEESFGLVHSDTMNRKIKKNVLEHVGLKIKYLSFVKEDALPRTAIGKIQHQKSKNLYYKNKVESIFSHKEIPAEILNNVVVEIKKLHEKFDMSRENILTYSQEVSLAFVRNKLFGVLVPVNYGGLGLSYSEFLALLMLVSEINVDLGAFWLNSSGISLLAINQYGSLIIKEKLFPRVVRGESRVSFSLTEVDGKIKSFIREEGGGLLSLNGQKAWGGARWANYTLIFANADGKDSGFLRAFILDLESNGIERGEVYDTMGLEILRQSGFTMKDVAIPADNELIENGSKILSETLGYSRLGVAVLALGAIKKSINVFNALIKDREINSGLLSHHPLIVVRVHQAKDYASVLEKIIFALCRLKESSSKKIPEALLGMVKALASDWSNQVLHQFFLSLGAVGYLRDCEFEGLYRSSLGISIIEGSNDSLFSMVGRSLLESGVIEKFLLNTLEVDLTCIKELRFYINAISNKAIKSSDYDKKQKFLFLHYHVGKSLSPYIVYLMLKNLDKDYYDIDITVINSAKKIYLQEFCCFDREGGEKGENDIANRNNNDSLLTVTPATKETEEWMRNWCIENLELNGLAVKEISNFFEVGMDSLYGAAFVRSLNEKFKIELEPFVIWQYSDIASLSLYIQKSINGSAHE